MLQCDYRCGWKCITDKLHKIQCEYFRHHGIEVKDFGPSWRDGVAFQSVVHAIRPDLVDMEAVRTRSNRENLEEAFALAENELGIPRLLDPEGACDLSCFSAVCIKDDIVADKLAPNINVIYIYIYGAVCSCSAVLSSPAGQSRDALLHSELH